MSAHGGAQEGGGPAPQPPKAARAVLRLALGSRSANEALESLDELFMEKVAEQGSSWARRWYWRQVLGFLLRTRSVKRELAARRRDEGGLGFASQHRPVGGVFASDVRLAFRSLRKAPGYAVVATLTLALGMGVTLAMAGVLEAALFRPLPFPEGDRLVMGRATWDGQLNPWVSGADFFDYEDRADAFQGLAAILPFPMDRTVTGIGDPERITSTVVSTSFFSTLGVAPRLGRSFTEDEGTSGSPNVVIVSWGFWQRQLGGEAAAVGQSVTLDGTPFTVVGVMPAGFHFLLDVDLWVPMRPDQNAASRRDRSNWFVLGRLASGVSLEQAQANMEVVSAQLRDAYPETNELRGLLLTHLRDVLVEGYGRRLAVLMGAAVLVLLIACLNVTGMMLARAPARARELSIRSALGAERGRLVRSLLVEALALAGVGGAMGIGLALAFQSVALDYLRMDRLGLHEPQLSVPLVLAGLCLFIVTGLAAGIYPSVRSGRVQISEALKVGARQNSHGGTVFRSGLVVLQISFSVVLLVASGLLVRSFAEKRSVDPGFRSADLLVAGVDLSQARYPTAWSRIQFFSQLQSEIAALPDVSSASAVSHLPIRSPFNFFHVKGPHHQDRGETAFLRSVLPGYFTTMGIPLTAGRTFDADDTPNGASVGVINEAMAAQFFPNETAVGQDVELDWFGTPVPLTVVGVVGNVRMSGLETEPTPALYLPHTQLPYTTMQLVVRGDGNPRGVIEGIRNSVRRADAEVPLTGLATMDEVIGESISEDSLVAMSATVYALLPLLLAAVGLYAVIASYVTQHRHEIGIRMALGAEPSKIGREVMGRGMRLLAVGMVAGLAAAFWLTRFMEALLFGLTPTDVPTFVGVATAVALVALVACAVPVVRAVRSDPKSVLETG